MSINNSTSSQLHLKLPGISSLLAHHQQLEPHRTQDNNNSRLADLLNQSRWLQDQVCRVKNEMAEHRALMNQYFDDKELELQSLTTAQSRLVRHINRYNAQQEQSASYRDVAGDMPWANASSVTHHHQQDQPTSSRDAAVDTPWTNASSVTHNQHGQPTSSRDAAGDTPWANASAVTHHHQQEHQEAAFVQDEQQRQGNVAKRSRHQGPSNKEPADDEAALSERPAKKARTADPLPIDADGYVTRPGRYSVARRTTPRYASGPPGTPFRFSRMPRTALSVWNEWHCGANGNPAIRLLEEQFGTGWRLGDLAERKYASNWVATRKLIVDYVDNKAAVLGLSGPQVCNRLDLFVGGHVHRLIGGLRKGHDVLDQFEAGRNLSATM
ncbi:hypothetical protein CDD82_3584 [Ophiocordyceps australis]|uniref:Transcription activator GCR1-like domain-containing protein n=1 Tax=Ophiocordyceps australis TaxID=1399860 RepID=A0A2C5XNJ0_9HYPO|nr:hypothetical protein CDD82_3584 [Ophiocordyceps australis]